MAPLERVKINFFKPTGESMKRDVAATSAILLLWLVLSYGIPLAIWIAGRDELGTSWFTETRIFGFPLHYWLLAQGCTIGYVVLCKLYCLFMDRSAKRQQASFGKAG